MDNSPYDILKDYQDSGLVLVKYVIETSFKNATRQGFEKEELMGVGSLALLEACTKYNGSGNFTTFAYHKIKQRIIDFMRRQCQQPHVSANNIIESSCENGKVMIEEFLTRKGERKLRVKKNGHSTLQKSKMF